MKLFVLALLVAAVAAAPLDDSDGSVDLIVNGVPDGHALELGDVVGIKLKEHVEGEVVATDLLRPHTAVGIAEAVAASAADEASADALIPQETQSAYENAAPEAVVMPAPAMPEFETSPELVIPSPVVLPAPAIPEIIPEPAVLTEPPTPEVVEAVVPAKPEFVIPESVILPAPAIPEVFEPELPAPVVAEEAPELPAPSAQNGEVFNDGTLQVTVNAPETGLISTIQNWFNLVVNYVSAGDVKSQQVV